VDEEVQGMTAQKDKSPQKSPKAQAECAERDAAGKAASDRFVEDLEVRGEAVQPSKSGKLPPGATHAVVAENPDGTAKEVKRARFKMF
jgi:hypothetical protein